MSKYTQRKGEPKLEFAHTNKKLSFACLRVQNMNWRATFNAAIARFLIKKKSYKAAVDELEKQRASNLENLYELRAGCRPPYVLQIYTTTIL